MEYNNGSIPESKISIQSKNSIRSFSKSVGRPSWQIREPSLGKKVSLVQYNIQKYLSAMSIQSQRKSDIFERLLQSQKKPKSRLSNIVGAVYQSQEQQYNSGSFIQRNSDIVGQECQFQINHECTCFNQCLKQQCPCFKAKQQICVKGSCCIICIQLKNHIMRINNQHKTNPQGTQSFVAFQANLQHQQQIQQQQSSMNQPQIICNCRNTQCLKSYCKCFQRGGFCSQKCGCQPCKNKQQSQQRTQALNTIKINNQTIFCTCKKTKCNKKYCSCYNSGMKCSKLCSCENCLNCDKENEMQIEVYAGEQNDNYQQMQMPERMSFQPVNFE